MNVRSGVEDTKLEAKAKNTKNFEGKDRPSRGQGQGHRRKHSPKKGFQKNFSSDLKKKGLQNFFQVKKVFKKFFSGDFHLRNTKKSPRKFLQGFWHFPTKFQWFKKESCPRAKDGAIFEDLRLQGHSQGL